MYYNSNSELRRSQSVTRFQLVSINFDKIRWGQAHSQDFQTANGGRKIGVIVYDPA